MKAKSVPLRKMYKALIRMIKNRKETQFFYIRNKKIRHNYKNYGHWQNTHIYYELFNTHEFGYLTKHLKDAKIAKFTYKEMNSLILLKDLDFFKKMSVWDMILGGLVGIFYK